MFGVGDGRQFNTGQPGHLNIVKPDHRTRQKVGPVIETLGDLDNPLASGTADAGRFGGSRKTSDIVERERFASRAISFKVGRLLFFCGFISGSDPKQLPFELVVRQHLGGGALVDIFPVIQNVDPFANPQSQHGVLLHQDGR